MILTAAIIFTYLYFVSQSSTRLANLFGQLDDDDEDDDDDLFFSSSAKVLCFPDLFIFVELNFILQL